MKHKRTLSGKKTSKKMRGRAKQNTTLDGENLKWNPSNFNTTSDPGRLRCDGHLS